MIKVIALAHVSMCKAELVLWLDLASESFHEVFCARTVKVMIVLLCALSLRWVVLSGLVLPVFTVCQVYQVLLQNGTQTVF